MIKATPRDSFCFLAHIQYINVKDECRVVRHCQARHCPHRSFRHITGEATALARSTVNLLCAWELTDAEARALLGDMAQRIWACAWRS